MRRRGRSTRRQCSCCCCGRSAERTSGPCCSIMWSPLPSSPRPTPSRERSRPLLPTVLMSATTRTPLGSSLNRCLKYKHGTCTGMSTALSRGRLYSCEDIELSMPATYSSSQLTMAALTLHQQASVPIHSLHVSCWNVQVCEGGLDDHAAARPQRHILGSRKAAELCWAGPSGHGSVCGPALLVAAAPAGAATLLGHPQLHVRSFWPLLSPRSAFGLLSPLSFMFAWSCIALAGTPVPCGCTSASAWLH